MKKVFIVGLIVLFATITKAQINAITETGDEVVLYNDGTWKYLNDSTFEASEIPINDKQFVKGKNSTFLIKSTKLNIGIWMDPKSWSFTKGTLEDASEFEFEKKGEDLYAMLISEKIQIPIETLKIVALQNAKRVSSDIELVQEEYRNVNGIQVLMMQMKGTLQGMKFSYFGYYYSNSNGTIQLLAYTSENLFDNYKQDIELFLNGLTEL